MPNPPFSPQTCQLFPPPVKSVAPSTFLLNSFCVPTVFPPLFIPKGYSSLALPSPEFSPYPGVCSRSFLGVRGNPYIRSRRRPPVSKRVVFRSAVSFFECFTKDKRFLSPPVSVSDEAKVIFLPVTFEFCVPFPNPFFLFCTSPPMPFFPSFLSCSESSSRIFFVFFPPMFFQFSPAQSRAFFLNCSAF